MNSLEDAQYLLNEAEAAINDAQKTFELSLWRVAVHFSQVAIEEAIKAIISCFYVFEWTHDPGKQLLRIMDENKENIEKIFSQEEADQLNKLVNFSAKYAPWHGRSIYGEFIPGKSRISPAQLCKEEVAQEIIDAARLSCQVAKNFIHRWFTLQ